MAGSDIVKRLTLIAEYHLRSREHSDTVLAGRDEIALLRAKVRHLSEPLPDDPGGHMWSTLNFLASREGDDLETEVAHWASKSITHLRARVAELEAALQAINRRASPTYDRTFDVCSRDLYWCACEARRALGEESGP